MKGALLQELRCTGRIELIDELNVQCNSDHKALNYAIQGDAAILIKHWAMESVKRLSDTSYRLLAVVHDELQGECLPMVVSAAMHVLEQTAADAGRYPMWLVKKLSANRCISLSPESMPDSSVKSQGYHTQAVLLR